MASAQFAGPPHAVPALQGCSFAADSVLLHKGGVHYWANIDICEAPILTAAKFHPPVCGPGVAWSPACRHLGIQTRALSAASTIINAEPDRPDALSVGNTAVTGARRTEKDGKPPLDFVTETPLKAQKLFGYYMFVFVLIHFSPRIPSQRKPKARIVSACPAADDQIRCQSDNHTSFHTLTIHLSHSAPNSLAAPVYSCVNVRGSFSLPDTASLAQVAPSLGVKQALRSRNHAEGTDSGLLCLYFGGVSRVGCFVALHGALQITALTHFLTAPCLPPFFSPLRHPQVTLRIWRPASLTYRLVFVDLESRSIWRVNS
ncbi:hypothetical protein B0H19DRAFT_1312898 [Mycena capillaripes]|nr:hypothetical protein B0H19DRAFT_1312898 [Mycena capillaripes]